MKAKELEAAKALAKKMANKYIKPNGNSVKASMGSEADKAWKKHAETVHRVLRDAKDNSAISAFEQIGDAIHKDAFRRRSV